MMKKILLIVSFLLSVQIGYCQEEKQPLQLIVKSDKETYSQGEQIKLSVGIKNNSTKDISICIFDIEHRLMENLSFFDEGYPPDDGKFYTVTAARRPVNYRLKDWTKRKLSVVTGEDFIFLKPQEEYSVKLIVDTVMPADFSWGYIYEKESDWRRGEGLGELPAVRYQITAKYENSIVGIDDDGCAIHAHDVQSTVIIKMHNAWFGVITSNTIAIKIREKISDPLPLNERSDAELLEELGSLQQEFGKNSEINNDGEASAKMKEIETILKKRKKYETQESLPWSNKFPHPYKNDDSFLVNESYSGQWVKTSVEKWPGAVSKAKEVLKEWGQDPEKYEYEGKRYDYEISVFESSSFISVVFYPVGLEGLERHVEVRLRDCSEMPINSKKRKYFEVVVILPGA